MQKKYYKRTLEKELRQASKEFPVLALTGPRQTGKSTLLQHIFPEYHYCSLDDPQKVSLIKKDPELFLAESSPFLILDEIQYAPEILPYIKLAVDKNRSQNGQFILTGSQIFPLMSGVSETLAGRIALFELLGFSWEELEKANPQSLLQCFKQIKIGFYPEPSVHNVSTQNFYASYLRTYLERDIRQIQSVQDLVVFQQFLELLAARTGSLLNLNEIGRECGVSHTTAKQWLSLLEVTRIVYLLRPYYKNISKRVIKSPKIYFTDTGLLTHILKYPDEKTLLAGPMSGQIFENMFIAEVLKEKFNRNRLFEMYFFRDSNHQEVDLILEEGAKQILVEIKMSQTLRTNFADPLKKTQGIFPQAIRFVVSSSQETLSLSQGIKALPWWDLQSILNQS